MCTGAVQGEPERDRETREQPVCTRWFSCSLATRSCMDENAYEPTNARDASWRPAWRWSGHSGSSELRLVWVHAESGFRPVFSMMGLASLCYRVFVSGSTARADLCGAKSQCF